MNDLSLPKDFPNSVAEPFTITSPITRNYNCIAWAFGDDSKWYWPDDYGIGFWPIPLKRECSSESFVDLFKSIGFVPCKTDKYETNFEKIALFLDVHGFPTHAAKQIDEHKWSSKLGELHDVGHTIKSIEDGLYGKAIIFMKRKKMVK